MTSAELAARRQAYVTKLDEAARAIADSFRQIDGVERVSLFGSYARGRRDLGTDLDVLVVWDTEMPFLDRLRLLYGRVPVGVDLDIVCYTPGEYRELREQPFLRHVSAGEVVLYAKKSA